MWFLINVIRVVMVRRLTRKNAWLFVIIRFYKYRIVSPYFILMGTSHDQQNNTIADIKIELFEAFFVCWFKSLQLIETLLNPWHSIMLYLLLIANNIHTFFLSFFFSWDRVLQRFTNFCPFLSIVFNRQSIYKLNTKKYLDQFSINLFFSHLITLLNIRFDCC